MLKFLRKYNTIILVVFGSLLMVAFLVPQAIQRLGQNPKGRVVARLGDKSIRAMEYQFAAQELRAIGSIAPQLVAPGGMLGFDVNGDNDAHWILLSKAAEDAGVVGEGNDGATWVPELLQLLAVQIAQSNMFQQNPQFAQQFWSDPQYAQFRDQMVQQVYVDDVLPTQDIRMLRAASDAGLQLAELDTALAKLRGVFRLIDTHNRMARISQPRAERESKSIGDQAVADALFLSSSLVEGDVAAPTPEQLQAHFERFRETKAFEGEFGIGYFMPPRVKVEVLKIDHEAIAAAFTPDPVAVSRRYQRNIAEFGDDFSAVKEGIENRLRSEFADEVMRKADRHVKAFTLRARDSLALDGEFYVLPENWDEIRPTLEQISTFVVEQVEKDIHADGNADFVMPRPEVNVLAAKWQTFTDLQGEAAVASGAVTIANQRVSISQLVFNVHEFEPEVELGFQVGLPAIGLVASDLLNNHYFFTVLAVQDESPAAFLDEVLERATEDFISLAAYESLVARSEEFKSLAIEQDLQAVSDLFAVEATLPDISANIAGSDADPTNPQPDTGTEAVPGPPLMENLRVGDPALVQFIIGEANDQLFRDAILEAAALIDPYTAEDEINADGAVVVVPLPARLGVLLGRVRLPRPLTIERYRVLQADASRLYIVTELRDALEDASNPYSYDSLVARYSWSYVNAKDSPADDENAAEDVALTTEGDAAPESTASGDN